MLPAAIYLLVMFVYPFAYGVVLSLQAKDGGLSLANYLAFFLDPWQARTVWVTASIAVPNTVLTVLLALGVAYTMRRGSGWSARSRPRSCCRSLWAPCSWPKASTASMAPRAG